ncbi:MAG: hypothetical protein E7658_01320 [Ruminococcaceae bacterium]|nr:hypothetical protein [Oscillospiraceae bacterium]
MADHYNYYPLKQFARTIADCMGMSLPEEYAPSIDWAANILKDRMGGTADRVVLYHADAVPMYVWQKYTNLFAPVYRHTSMSIPFLSTVQSKTPVAHASMYTGLDPEQHGIQTYTRPKLECDTLYDQLIKNGKKVAVIAMENSSFLFIFAGRQMDYFVVKTPSDVLEKATELIRSDEYDVISIHTFEYDNAAHAFGPESKQALNAISTEAENFAFIMEELRKFEDQHRILVSYSPDHGQHLVEGGRGTHGSLMIEDMNILHFFGTI